MAANAVPVLRDARGLLVAQSTWFRYQALRAASMVDAATDDPQVALALNELVKLSRSEHAETMAAVGYQIQQVHRQLQDGETLRHVLCGKLHLRARADYIAVTDRRVLLAQRKAFDERGEVGIDISLPADHVTFQPATASSGPRLTVEGDGQIAAINLPADASAEQLARVSASISTGIRLKITS